jgi:hypothetical protein
LLNFITGAPFTTGRARYFDHDTTAAEGTGKIFVRIAAQGMEGPILAQLDTGAAWSVINAEIAEELGLLNGAGELTNLSTRHGPVSGRLESATIQILADDGSSLDVDATVFVSAEWMDSTFLGYSGLLERIRFGLDPQSNDFHFGAYHGA